jgi:8-amino-7-oxononanoate synthase
MKSLDDFAALRLAALEAQNLRRTLRPTARQGGVRVARGGRSYVSFSCNDYLGLAQDPRVIAAGVEALQTYGAGAGASRLVTGDHPLLGALEAKLAAFKKTEAAVVFGSGYLANTGIVPALTEASDLVLLDSLCHSCMAAGARLSGARILRFEHNDLTELESILSAQRKRFRRVLILTERVFSMDGDRAPEAALMALAERYDSWVLIDDAHGIGVVTPEAYAPLEMGTLSKALGSYGGYVCPSGPVADLLRNQARSFVFSTGLPPASAGAAMAALEIAQSEPERGARVLDLARRLTRRLNLPDAQSAIVPFIVGDAGRAVALSQKLQDQGFLVVAIRPPTVPKDTARLRIAFSAAHTEDEVDALAEALAAAAPDLLERAS